MMILDYYSLYDGFSNFLGTYLLPKILTFVSYLEKIFFLGYHSWFICLSWINKISCMAKNEEQAREGKLL